MGSKRYSVHGYYMYTVVRPRRKKEHLNSEKNPSSSPSPSTSFGSGTRRGVHTIGSLEPLGFPFVSFQRVLLSVVEMEMEIEMEREREMPKQTKGVAVYIFSITRGGGGCVCELWQLQQFFESACVRVLVVVDNYVPPPCPSHPSSIVPPLRPPAYLPSSSTGYWPPIDELHVLGSPSSWLTLYPPPSPPAARRVLRQLCPLSAAPPPAYPPPSSIACCLH